MTLERARNEDRKGSWHHRDSKLYKAPPLRVEGAANYLDFLLSKDTHECVHDLCRVCAALSKVPCDSYVDFPLVC